MPSTGASRAMPPSTRWGSRIRRVVRAVIASVRQAWRTAGQRSCRAAGTFGRRLRHRTPRTALTAVLLLLVAPASLWAQPVSEGDPRTAGQASEERSRRATVIAGQDGFAIQSADRDFSLQIGLLVHADGVFAPGDSGQQVVDSFVFRRLRPYLRGRFSERFEFYFVPDFAGGTLVVQDAYVDTIFGPAFRIRAGKGKTPFGLERLHSASNLTFFNRALPTALVPNRDLGIQVLGDVSGGLVSYLAGVLNGVPDGGSADADSNDGKDLSGRLIVRPFNRRTGSLLHGLGVGIAGSRGRQSGTRALPAFRTQMLEQSYFSYDGASADGVRTRYSPQAFYYYKALGGFAEYVHTSTPILKGPLRARIAHDAWQVAGSFVITGETATDAGVGVRPRADFDPQGGDFGAFQVAARYHVLAVDHRAVSLGLAAGESSRKAEAWTVGLNWYLTVNVRYTFNFERTVFDDDPDGPRRMENALVFRTQVSF